MIKEYNKLIKRKLREFGQPLPTDDYDEVNSADEMDELSPDTNVRHYEEGDKVHLREGGEGRILKIVYIVMTDTECNEVEVMRATDLGNAIG